MNADTIAEKRRAIALDAHFELTSILNTLPRINQDDYIVVRGLAMRAQTLAWIVYSSSGLGPAWATLEEDARALYGSSKSYALAQEAQQDEA